MVPCVLQSQLLALKSRRRNRANTDSQKYDWVIDNITKMYVKLTNGAIIPVASRTTLVVNRSLLMNGEWVPQDLKEIGLLEALEDEVVRDLYLCVILQFLRDLYLSRHLTLV